MRHAEGTRLIDHRPPPAGQRQKKAHGVEVEDAKLLALVAAIANGGPVDWDAEARGFHADDGGELLRCLRIVAQVAQRHRAESKPAEDVTSGPSGAGPRD